jgi:hypothetical protein
MWKKLMLMILVLTLISVFIVPSAEAGYKSLLKVLALGGLLAAFPPPPPIVISPAPAPYYSPSRQEYVPGHWEVIREWVPGTWERVWIPGHYDRWGRRVAGHYEDRQIPGHYVERKVWVDGYYRPY